jgi:hypothetical protein
LKARIDDLVNLSPGDRPRFARPGKDGGVPPKLPAHPFFGHP